MLAEWLKHLTTPCPPPLKAMGYLKELIAMQARHRRCHDAWAPHLRECRAVIDKATEDIGHKKVTVLGSGLLLDFSLDMLADSFDDVVLVDIVHLPAVQKRVRAFANVRLVSVDVAGIAEATWDHVTHGRTDALPSPRADAGPYADSDLVISANLLTQLPLMPLGLLMDKAKGYPDDAIKTFARHIVENHLALLGALPGRACLVTETERVIYGGPSNNGGGDEMIEEIDPLFGAAIPASGRKWIWNIAPRPEINPHIDLRFRMTGIVDLKAAIG
jgi:hypothetical protein